MKNNVKYKSRHKESITTSLNSYDGDESFQSDKAVHSDVSFDSDNQYGQINITETMLAEYLNKYDNYQKIIEKVMPEEYQRIDQITANIYENCIEIYEREYEEEEELDYSYSYFNFENEIEKLRLEERSEEDIIKLMYILSITLSKYIHIHKDQFFSNYPHFESIKKKLSGEINNEINSSLIAKLGENFGKTINLSVNTTNKKTENKGEKQNAFSLGISCNNGAVHNIQISTEGGKKIGYLQSQSEKAFISKISKENCISILSDLYTSYELISKFLEHVVINFLALIEKYNKIVNCDKELVKIFLEELVILHLDDQFLKVSLFIYIPK